MLVFAVQLRGTVPLLGGDAVAQALGELLRLEYAGDAGKQADPLPGVALRGVGEQRGEGGAVRCSRSSPARMCMETKWRMTPSRGEFSRCWQDWASAKLTAARS